MKVFLFTLFFLSTLVAKESFSNHLINESSPYLQQHAHNLVHWYPWGKEALSKAKREKKLIFLSIGYSTCHWCHVMEQESFENKEIAKLLNRDYIAIKVDREERPDLDRYYQKIHQIITQRGGGWPLTIILTPNTRPIFAATYIPAKDRYGMDGLETILPYLAKEYRKNPKKLESIGKEVLSISKQIESQKFRPHKVSKAVINKTINELYARFDKKYGGFGEGVKFPREATLLLLIDIYKLSQSKKALGMLTKTLDAMAKGGIYDQIEGGFFRYSTRRDFSIPHFEKMLYTNALLIEVYTKAYFITKKPLYKRVVLESIAQIDKRFRDKNLYFSASDADSDGVEGGYFVYSYDEALKALMQHGYSQQKAKKELAKLGFSEDGNFEEELNHPLLKAKVAPKTLAILRDMRKNRSYPFIDYKKLTAWNAMYIYAKLLASRIDSHLEQEALSSLNSLLQKLYAKNRLSHQLINNKAQKEALLEDYAYLIQALIEANQLTLDAKYLTLANKLFKQAKKRLFYKERWYFSLQDYHLLASIEDSSYPSALGILLKSMLQLASLNEDLGLYAEAKKELKRLSAFVARSPSYYPTLTRVYLELLYKDILIQAKKTKLLALTKRSLALPYPYILFLPNKSDSFSLCTITQCFATTKSLEELDKILKKHH